MLRPCDKGGYLIQVVLTIRPESQTTSSFLVELGLFFH